MERPQSGRSPSPAAYLNPSHGSAPQHQQSLDPALLETPLFVDDFSTDFSQPAPDFGLDQSSQFFDIDTAAAQAAGGQQFTNLVSDHGQEFGVPAQGQQDQFPSFDTGADFNSYAPHASQQHSLLDPKNISLDTHSPTPPKPRSSSTAISSRSTSPRATPSPQSYQLQPTRSRNTSESLDPSSAAYPHGYPMGADWASGAAFRGHRRRPSDTHSDVSAHSNQASPYIGHVDQFDQHVSPLLPAQNAVSFSNAALGFAGFTLNDQTFPEHLSPVPSIQNSPRVPLEQQPLPVFTANDNFGLNSNLDFNQTGNANFNNFPDMQMFDRSPLPTLDVTGAQDTHVDTMSPPEINIQFAPPSRQPSFGPRSRAASTNELIPPEASE